MSEDNPRCPKCEHRLSCCICKPDPRPAAVSAPAGEATEAPRCARCGKIWGDHYDGDFCDKQHTLVWREPARSPAPASGAPDEGKAEVEQIWAALGWAFDEGESLAMAVRKFGLTRSDMLIALHSFQDTISALRTRLAASERAGEAMREILREVAYGCDLGTTWLDDYAPTELMERILAALSPTSPAPSPEPSTKD